MSLYAQSPDCAFVACQHVARGTVRRSHVGDMAREVEHFLACRWHSWYSPDGWRAWWSRYPVPTCVVTRVVGVMYGYVNPAEVRIAAHRLAHEVILYVILQTVMVHVTDDEWILCQTQDDESGIYSILVNVDGVYGTR